MYFFFILYHFFVYLCSGDEGDESLKDGMYDVIEARISIIDIRGGCSGRIYKFIPSEIMGNSFYECTILSSIKITLSLGLLIYFSYVMFDLLAGNKKRVLIIALFLFVLFFLSMGAEYLYKVMIKS